MTDCEDEDDMSRSQSPMIPLTIENSVIKIKSEPGDEAEADYLEAAGHEDAEEDEEEEEELLNSSLTAMDWLPKLNARAGVLEEFVPYSYASLIRHAIFSTRASAPVPLLQEPDQPRLEELHPPQPESLQVLHEGATTRARAATGPSTSCTARTRRCPSRSGRRL